ncbi:MAG: flavin monoamine oxidase family protein, partial [Chloroflexota bacterium]
MAAAWEHGLLRYRRAAPALRGDLALVPLVPRLPEIDTIIIGAGLAGLAAALKLNDCGRACVVLEARDRVGGRVHTIRHPFSDGLHAEAGAEYINAEHEHVQALLRRFNLLNGRAQSAPRLYAFLNRRGIGQTVASLGADVATDLRQLGRRTAALGRMIPDPRLPWTAPTAKELDARSVRDWLQELALSPVTFSYLSVWQRLDYAIENDQISLLQLARDDRLYRAAQGQRAVRPPQAMDSLPRAMAAELGDRVVCNAEVTSIEHSDHGVTVAFHRDGRPWSIRGNQLVLAVPATVVPDITITPSLPEAHEHALRGLRYGTVVKVLMQFRHRFWLAESRIRGVMTDLPFLSAWDATHDQAGTRGILGTYTAGENGRLLAAMSDAERFDWCLAQLEQIFPAAATHFEAGYSAVWDREPFTRG